MMPVGYSLSLAEALRNSDSSCPSIQLGQLCLEKNIPVSEVALDLGVSRQTLYQWFFGRSSPRAKTLEAISEYLECLRQLPPYHTASKP